MEASAGGLRQRLVRRCLSGALVSLTLPCRLFLVRRFWQIQLLGPGRALDGSTTKQASHAGGRETGHGCAAAEQQESSAPDGDPAVRAGLPRPHDGRGRAARLARKGRLVRGFYRGPEARRAQQEFRDGGTGEEGSGDGDHGRRRGHERIGQGRGHGYGREDGDAGESRRRVSDGEIAEEEGDRHGTEEHRHDKRRYVRLAEELDSRRHEPTWCQLHYPLGYRHEDRRNRGVEPVDQLRDPERDHGPDHTGDPRAHPAWCLLLAHGGALQYLSL